MVEKIITFDCYGTLLNTDILYDEIAHHAEENGLSSEKARNIYTNYEDRLMYGEEFHPYKELIQMILDYCDQEMNTDIFHDYLSYIIEVHKNFKAYPDVLEGLRYLKNQGWKLVLMSNTSHGIMTENLKQFDGLIDDVLLADDVHHYKPQLDFFLAAQTRYGFSNDNHVHIANGYFWDIVPATKLNWRKIWVNRHHIRGNQREQPYQEINNLTEIKQIL